MSRRVRPGTGVIIALFLLSGMLAIWLLTDDGLPPPEAEPVAAIAEPVEQEIAPPAEIAAEADKPLETTRSAPALDIVRIESDGAGLVAGRAAPNETVEIISDDRVIGTGEAGADGAFVAQIHLEPGSKAQRVSARQAEAVETPPSAPVFVLATEEPEPLIVKPERAGVRILQGLSRGPSEQVTLDQITYDESGDVVLAGRAPGGSSVRVYLDDRSVGITETGGDGFWRFQPEDDVTPGDYRLRLDNLGHDGVSSRIETPFRREKIAEGEVPPDAAIVQKGDSLWRIAENIYGEGLRYTLILGANADTIRDPDLIYPGQVFSLPENPAPE